LDSRSIGYTYDDLYRLTEESIVDGTHGNRTSTYVYDKVGNRQTKTVNGVTTVYRYDGNDRLLDEKVNGNPIVTYGYDNNGSTIAKTENGITSTYVWNDDKRLVSATVNGKSISYTYNDQGIRVSSIVDGVETRYLLDEGITANVWEEYSPNGTVQASYVYGHDLISQGRSGVSSFYLVDGLGSTRLLTDSQGQVLNAYGYEAFGETVSQSGTATNAYQYAGEQFDGAMGDYYLRQRFYNTSSGRFGRMDTYEGDNKDPVTLNKYLYAGANPVSYVDPTGYFSLQEALSTLTALSFLQATFPTIAVGAGVLLNGFPDGVGFGSFTSGVPSRHRGPFEIEGITGNEITYNPKEKKAEVSVWSGAEGVLSFSDSHSSLSVGVYQAVYWENHSPHDPKTLLDNFSLFGATVPTGHFAGGTILPGTNERELLFGYGSSTEFDLFGLATGHLSTGTVSMSKGTMLALVSSSQALFTAGSGAKIGASFGDLGSAHRTVGTLAGALFNAGLFATWVNMTYGTSGPDTF
jgi:RHS repeat-associated protein